ncbi:MAG TPA: protein kinase [Longimicrobiales bacterium]|nr:protein kinase [Longimicrobiales bacterium]
MDPADSPTAAAGQGEIQGLPAILAGRYEIVRRVGQGATATVYRARDVKHDRDVAVKVLHPDIARELGRDRFLREIGIVARLTHPHILPLHDSGEADGLLYFVMPFVQGASLRDCLRGQRQLEVDEALRIGCELASALDCAHRAGVVHRDVKPDNVLLVDGHAVLTDFGVARAMELPDESTLTSTGLAIGTPLYMSPEQLAAETELDGRSDIYGLACVVYEMLVGDPPFAGRSVSAIFAKRMSGAVHGVRSVRPAVPVEVEEALVRALAPAPEDRFSTAEEFRAALEAQPMEGRRSRSSWGAGHARRGWRGVRLWATAAVVVLGGVGAWLVADRRPPGDAEALTLAVLPFTNMSDDVEQAYLADGLTDALIGELGAVRGLRVTSRASVMRYATAPRSAMGMGDMVGDPGPMGGAADGMSTAAPPKSIPDIARELRADLVMQGSLLRVGDSVRVATTVLDAGTQEALWRGDDVRHLRDMFSLQQDLARAVARVAGRGSLRARELSRPRPAYRPEAHEAYLKGAYFQAHWRLPDAVASFTAAVAVDPMHAPAQAGLARAYYFMNFFGDVPPGIALGAMRRAATAALEQDSLLAEAHGQLALVMMLQEWDWLRAEEHFVRALELNPSNAQIYHDYAHFLLATGRQGESVEATQAALALDPANPMLISCLGWHSLFDRRNEEAIAYAQEAHSMMPDQWAQVILGWALLGQDRPEEALAAFREATRLSARAFNRAALGYALAVTGHEDEAREIVAELLVRAEDEYVSAYDLATVYAALRDREETFRWLRRAAEERSSFFVHLAWDLRFDAVRDDERFQRLVDGDLGLGLPLTVAAATGRG